MSAQNDVSITTATKKVPFGQKVAFGLGMLANQMFPAILGIFMVVLVQDLGFEGWMWGILFFAPRVFDSITDPLMGFISDNTRSKWGRRRHYVFIGAIILGISFIIMWQLYRENGVDYNFMYFLLWSFVFYLGLTIFSVPFVAMGYEMSEDFHERTNIMAVAQWIGQWAWVIAPWFWVIMYDQDWFPNADTATRTLAIYVGITCMLLAMVPAIFIKSKSTKDDDSLEPLTASNIGGSLMKIFKSFVVAFATKTFRKMCIATFLIFNAFNTVASFSFFIIVNHLFSGDTGAAGIWPTLFGCVGALCTTFIVIPIVARMAKMLGKKRAFLICQGISIIGYILLWFLFVPGKPWMFLFALPFFSFGIGSLFTIMMSMTADVCDLDELKTGKRQEGMYGAIYWWMVKFGLAFAGLASGLIMTMVGFEPGGGVQPDGAVDGLRLFFSGLPIAGTLIAMIIMWNYDLSEERANEIRAQLEARKAPKGTAEQLRGKLLSLGGLSTASTAALVNFSDKSLDETKAVFTATLNEKLHGLCFSPYVEGQATGDILSADQIRRRMNKIMPYTGWVRSFSCTEGNELIPEIAKEYGLKTMVGAWLSKDVSKTEKELDSLVALAKAGKVDIAVVGNEVLLRKELNEAEIISYIHRVRSAIPSGIPVAYVDAYYHFVESPALVQACDIILANCYPFWEGAEIKDANAYLQSMYGVTKEAAQGKKVIISETGWPSSGQNIQEARPSAKNAMDYFVNTQKWAKSAGVEVFYFSSFDESWKVYQEGEVGGTWGLWNKDEELKYS